jgi:hypothetical protein
MQRQLLQISDRIPDDILLTLLKCFAQILTREPESSQKSVGPFIRAFTKIRDDSGQKQFSAILEEDETSSTTAALAPTSDVDSENECTFNYKIGNVVTQEFVYSMNGNGNNHDDCEDRESSNDAENNDNKNNSDGDQCEDNQLQNSDNNDSENSVNGDATINNDDADDEGSNENVEGKFNELAADEDINTNEVEGENDSENKGEDESMVYVQEIDIDDLATHPKVTLDDIEREINEMQMFLVNKKIQEQQEKERHERERIERERELERLEREQYEREQIELQNQQIELQNQINMFREKQIEDAYQLDVCVNLKKKGDGHHHVRKHHSKSKSILSKYLNGEDNGKYTRGDKEIFMNERPIIFDPNVPNTPEDFLKEKSIGEKINKKKQKMKNLDVNWQKLCDTKKVYK